MRATEGAAQAGDDAGAPWGRRLVRQIRGRGVRFLAGALVAVVLGVPAAAAAGEASFEGRVLLEDGEPVAGAIVQILGHPGSVTTDAEGRFVWSSGPAPPFHILVVLPGDRYASPVWIVSLEDAAEIRVAALSVSETVTITSGAVPHTEATPGSASAVVSGEAIRSRQAPRLTDVLEAVPGAGRSSDLHAGVPAIRGLSRGRTLLLIDGARVTTERRAGASGTFLDPFFLEAVEVVRGPSPVAYGSDAFGGVIHARTPRPRPGAPLEGRFRGTLGTGLPEASFGGQVSGSVSGTGLLVQGRRRVFGEYRSPEGTVRGSGAEDAGAMLRAARDVGGGLLGVGLQVDGGRNIGRPRRSSATTSYPKEDSTRLTVDYRLAPRWGFARMDATVFLGSHHLVTRREEGEVAAESGVTARDFMLRSRGVRPLGRGRIEFGTELLSRFGLESGTRVEPAGGPRPPGLAELFPAPPLAPGSGTIALSGDLDGAVRREASVFSHGDLPVGARLQASAGARLSATHAEAGGGRAGGTPRASAHRALSGFAALRADLSEGIAVTGQLSRGFRDPTLSDRYYAGLSGRGVVFGNPDLRPERAVQADVSLRFDRGRVSGGLHAYRYRIRDLVERYEGAADIFFFRNRGEALLRGVELELHLGEPQDPTHLDLSGALARGAAEDGRWLDGVAPAHFRAGLRRRLAFSSFAEVVLLGFAAHERPGPTEAAVDAHARLDLAVGFPVAYGAELRFSGRNLLDASVPISADRRAVLAPGRSVVGTLIWTLDSAP